MMIYLISFAATYPIFQSRKFSRHPISENHWKCSLPISRDALLSMSIAHYMILIVIPLIIIIGSQLLSFRELKKSTRQFGADSNRLRTLRSVLNTFVAVVVVFFALMIPSQIFSAYFQYLMIHELEYLVKNLVLYADISRYINLVLAFNSCINPLIYAKIYRRFPTCATHCRQHQEDASVDHARDVAIPL